MFNLPTPFLHGDIRLCGEGFNVHRTSAVAAKCPEGVCARSVALEQSPEGEVAEAAWVLIGDSLRKAVKDR